jgi:hypothetical protein
MTVQSAPTITAGAQVRATLDSVAAAWAAGDADAFAGLRAADATITIPASARRAVRRSGPRFLRPLVSRAIGRHCRSATR